MDDQLLTASQVGSKVQMSEATIYYLARSGQIPFIRMGKRTMRFWWSDVLEALRKNRVCVPYQIDSKSKSAATAGG